MSNKWMQVILAAIVACGIVWAAQDTSLTQREVRDPRQLEVWLETNASDAQTRLAAIESTGATGTNKLLTVGALTTTGAVTIAEGALANSTVLSADIKDGEIVNADVNASAAIAVSKLATTGTLPAWNAAAVTNLAGGNIASGNIAAARINNALLAPGPIGTGTPAAGSFTTVSASSDTELNGRVNFYGLSVNVTNNQVLLPTLARGTYLYTPTEAATNTLTNPTKSGDWVALINVGTNNMVVAKAANLALGGATRTLGQYDILVLRAASAAVWVEESFTDNTLGP